MKPHQRVSHSSGSRAPAQDEFISFYLPNAPYGEFCQWYPSPFSVFPAEIASLIGQPCEPSVVHDSITFNCAEQFMMYCKAGRFRDFARQVWSKRRTKGEAPRDRGPRAGRGIKQGSSVGDRVQGEACHGSPCRMGRKQAW
ncbi:uncharacterized protein F5Z01DRAFT_645673 [Emericellopsis atlantica]|uniref:NADAR domain-containing protein n=1 Tax=Emericellopsis atlantica TaxID=2614577 RepID=A0A9P7ZS85_9HYPO|nr:uncharacterized protein F5Z01DRAFT_645673 [Emericellopsis atlantica]KAG9257349.1 hypothetical protein F5Z01DRAFT_645673 [Emericellopsis atlantica]